MQPCIEPMSPALCKMTTSEAQHCDGAAQSRVRVTAKQHTNHRAEEGVQDELDSQCHSQRSGPSSLTGERSVHTVRARTIEKSVGAGGAQRCLFHIRIATFFLVKSI